jgi:long-chain acyl-CoA synthetase
LRPGTVGIPYDGIESRLDPESGEVQMRSPGVMQGYYKAPELTRDTFTPDGWLRTGDKGQLDEEGNLRIVGRVKDLFKTSKGKYVTPAPIEDKLVMHEAIEACCVTGPNLGQPIALAMLSAALTGQHRDPAQRAMLEASLEEHLRRINVTLDPHEQLDCIVIVTEQWTVENGIVTPTFKVKRNRIEEVYAANFEKWSGMRRAVVWHEA